MGQKPAVLDCEPESTRILAQRHFAMQQERPVDLDDIGLVALTTSLRTLLFTDGTVTRSLEAQTLSPAFVDVVDQTQAAAPKDVASYLDLPIGASSIRRRVAIGTEITKIPVIWAESHIVPARLPAGFLDLLEGTRSGIGESLQRVRLESWRDMLWFGLTSAPEWIPSSPNRPPVLNRLYRVITQGRPALLISENFSVERKSGVYRLSGSAE